MLELKNLCYQWDPIVLKKQLHNALKFPKHCCIYCLLRFFFIYKETEAQGDKVTYPKWHSLEVLKQNPTQDFEIFTMHIHLPIFPYTYSQNIRSSFLEY